MSNTRDLGRRVDEVEAVLKGLLLHVRFVYTEGSDIQREWSCVIKLVSRAEECQLLLANLKSHEKSSKKNGHKVVAEVHKDFEKWIKSLKDSVRHMARVAEDWQKKHQNSFNDEQLLPDGLCNLLNERHDWKKDLKFWLDKQEDLLVAFEEAIKGCAEIQWSKLKAEDVELKVQKCDECDQTFITTEGLVEHCRRVKHTEKISRQMEDVVHPADSADATEGTGAGISAAVSSGPPGGDKPPVDPNPEAADSGRLRCPYCGKEYKSATWLKKHIRKEHPGIPVPDIEDRTYVCPHSCGKAYTTPGWLNRHLKDKHGDQS